MFCSYYDITEAGNWEGKNILGPADGGSLLPRKRGQARKNWDVIGQGRKSFAGPQGSGKAAAGRQDAAGMERADEHRFSRALHGYWRPGLPRPGGGEYAVFAGPFPEEDGNRFSHLETGGASLRLSGRLCLLIQGCISRSDRGVGLSPDSSATGGWVLEEFAEEDSSAFVLYATGAGRCDCSEMRCDGPCLPEMQSYFKTCCICRSFAGKVVAGRALSMCGSLAGLIRRYPGSFGAWACLFQELAAGTAEIAVVGPAFTAILPGLLALYLPHSVVIGALKRRIRTSHYWPEERRRSDDDLFMPRL